ncbi:9 kDa protein [polyscias crinivirus 1]|nr:9 kDa protein [polyscias crinivirus 1]
MDLEEVIDSFGLDSVEKFLVLYNNYRFVGLGHVDVLLNIINQFFVEFDSQRVKLPIEIEEVKPFLQCFCVFKRSGLRQR